MKKHFRSTSIVTCLFVLLTTALSAQWRWVNPSPQGNQLSTSYFTSGTNGWVAGQKGALLQTANGGQNWTAKYTGHFEDITGIYFSSTTNGYIAQGSYFLRTGNGGLTWSVRNYFNGVNIRKMFFLNADTGWVCGTNGFQEQLLFTSDSGSTWTVQNTPTQAIDDLYFLSGGQGWLPCSDGTIYQTSNYGQNWTNTVLSGNPVLNNIQFVDNLTGYVSGDGGVFFKSTDGGVTWNPVTNPASNSSIGLHAMYFSSADTGVVAGTDGFIIKTVDGGTTWSTNGVSGWFTGYQMEYVAANELFLMGTNGEILHSTDNGETWASQQTRITENNLHSVVATSATTLFSCGDNGTILKSTNGGQAWTLLNSNVGDNLNALAFTTSNIGVAVGNFGQITRTTDGGANWNYLTSGTGEDLLAVYKMNSTTLMAAGRNAALITSTDGGATWTDIPTILTGSSIALTDIYFTTQDSGWIATDGSQILYTYDGGVNWNLSVIPTAGPINSIYFTDSNNGWICTGNGEVLNTTDAGANWSINTNNYIGSFGRVVFTDHLNGWVLGDQHVIRTDNGGVSWNEEINPSKNSIEDAVFLTGSDAIAVGAGIGTILARSGDLHLSVPSADLCTDMNYNITLTTNGTFNPGNQFTVELSDNFGSFQFPYQIGSVSATGSSVIFITIPGGINDGPGYRLRVVSTNPPSYSPAYSGTLTIHTSPNAYAVAAGPTAFCQGDSVTIYNDYNPLWTYQWYVDGIAVPGATADSIVAYATGNFTVTVSDGTCSLTSPIVDVFVSTCSGLSQIGFNNKTYKASPNPTAGLVNIAWPETEVVSALTIRDLSGRVLEQRRTNDNSSLEVDLRNLNSGIYFIMLEGTSPGILKIVKY